MGTAMRGALVALALERSTPGQRAKFGRLLGERTLDENGVGELRRIVVRTGALRAVESMVAERTARSMAALEDAPICDHARGSLLALALAATVRSF